MECEVRVVGGIQSCFVSLPLFLIQTLQSTVRGGILPPLLALELRSRSGDQRWNVAWSGSASRSTAIEVAQQLAECISLPDFMQVRIKVIQHLPKAEMVSVEPCTEDDWEILELNSDLAENNILTQVGILQEGMKFPIWLHNHTVVRFLVQSVSPKQAMAQLIPGTEVVVAPKTRGKCKNSYQDVQAKTSISRQHHRRALLRIQEENKRFVHKMQFRDVELGVVLTTAIFMHPVTARNLSFNNFQLVEILSQCCQDEAQSKDSTRHTIVHLLLSDSVARGHVMVPHSLRLFLRAGVHSWVSLKIIDSFSKQNVSKLTLSPCRFKLNARNEAYSNSNDLNNLKKDLPTTIGMPSATNTSDWSLHGELLASLCHLSSKDDDDTGSEDETRKKEYPIHAWFTERFKEIAQYAGLSRHDKFLTSHSHVSPEEEAISEYQTRQKECLIHAWLTGQLRTISQYAGEVTIDSVVLTDETLFHFEVVDPKSTESGGISENSGATAKDPVEVMFLLSTNYEENSAVEFSNGFDLSFKLENGITGLNLELKTVEFGEPISLISVMDNKLDWKDSSTTSSLSWLEMTSPDAIRRLTVLLSASSGKLFSAYQLPLPGHVLIYGPSGCGKTSLNRAIARYFEEHEAILAHIVFVSCSDLASEKTPTIRQTLKSCISEAMVHSPSLVIFDDLDKLVPTSSELEGSQPSNSVIQLVGFLTGVMDEYAETRQNTCGLGPIAFLASSRTLGNLPQDLVSPGRFDFHIQLPAPGAIERSDILNHKIQERSLQCAADVVSDLASKCDGYDAHDLDALVNRAVHAATGRYRYSQAINENKTLTLIRDDFSQAMQDFTPFAMRSIKKVAQEERSGWEDVGGLADIRNTIQEMLEMPSKFSSIFSKAPLRLRSNVLLYGPPGCGKTHIVGAAASACSLRFISVKGPELLNKYIGASEQAVRDLFTKAAAAAPCLLFFDEFDSIAPKRGHDNTGVTDRVVNQLLTELDGVETLTGVFVFAATSRPDLLDAALLRPGRLDRLLFCDFPSWHDRLEILKVLSRKLPLASDVNLETIASMTEGFTGADLQALLSDTQLALVNELIANNDSGQPAKEHIISDVLLRSVASQARPSVSNSEKERLYAIYSQFLDAKKSVNSRARDAKGKRATLA